MRELVAQLDPNNNPATAHVTVMDGAIPTQVPVVRQNWFNIMRTHYMENMVMFKIQVPEKIIQLAREAGVDLTPHVTPAPPGETEPTVILPDGSIVDLPKGGATPEGGIRLMRAQYYENMLTMNNNTLFQQAIQKTGRQAGRGAAAGGVPVCSPTF